MFPMQNLLHLQEPKTVFNQLAKGFNKQPRRGGINTNKVKALFENCKSDPNLDVNFKRVCNADLSRNGIRKVAQKAITDFDNFSFRRDSILVMPSFCLIVYQFRIKGANETITIEIHQCDEVKDALYLFKIKLKNMEEVESGSLNPDKIGTYGIARPSGVISFARDTIYANIAGEALQRGQLSNLAKALDDHFLAPQGRAQQVKLLPRCVLLSTDSELTSFGEKFGYYKTYCVKKSKSDKKPLTLSVGDTTTLIMPIDESQYRLSYAFVEDTDIVGLDKFQRIRGHHKIVAKAMGETQVALAVLHKTSFHMYRGQTITIKVAPPISEEELLSEIWSIYNEIEDGRHPELTAQLKRG
ncbi:hypothetical protein ABW21_db0208430 [Orbilia brochopaga]|nr:hypothetical protein ABW21_db0208430 [Drechslerella brochopaga]